MRETTRVANDQSRILANIDLMIPTWIAQNKYPTPRTVRIIECPDAQLLSQVTHVHVNGRSNGRLRGDTEYCDLIPRHGQLNVSRLRIVPADVSSSGVMSRHTWRAAESSLRCQLVEPSAPANPIVRHAARQLDRASNSSGRKAWGDSRPPRVEPADPVGLFSRAVSMITGTALPPQLIALRNRLAGSITSSRTGSKPLPALAPSRAARHRPTRCESRAARRNQPSTHRARHRHRPATGYGRLG